MVESPTYYHSLSPVLRSLKEFDMESFPLQEEVIYSRCTSQPPDYLQQADTVNTSPIYKVKEESSEEEFWFVPDDNDISNGRMEFARFLEVFSKHSSTSLEASQCEALRHALMNRMAIIQGPPGCGKTFIGAKIVQLLLTLSPKLEKPILLLTYKNHALDEFLKHMLEFCRIDDMVRIGSRSKEPKLVSCYLQSLMKELMENKIYSKAIYVEIQKTRDKIDELEERIKALSSHVDASSHLTKNSFFANLSEEQLSSLLVEAAWRKNGGLTNRGNKKKLADRSWTEKFVAEIVENFGSIKNLLQTGDAKNDEACAHCFKMFDKAFEAWLPDRRDLRRMKEFHAQFVLQVRSERWERGGASNAPDYDDNQDSGDEEYVKELVEARMVSGFKQGERSNYGRVIFKSVKNNNKKDVVIEISDYPDDMEVGPQIRSVKNLWDLNNIERLQFLYCILNEKTSSTSEEFEQLIEKLEKLKKRKEEMEMNEKVEMLSQKKIIGVTITGASINHDLIHQIGPSIVIVEEAAEILEPSLLAALTPSIEHLILIGDHKQLRPHVDTYKLCKNFQFDKSMMERLIDSGFPFKSLTKQNRMRPEFSALMHDIYPYLEDNLEIVSKNEPLKCIAKSMFFWSHEHPEKKDRTFTNAKEADRVIALVLYLLWNGCQPSEITVLSAYLGQTKLLRNRLMQVKTTHAGLFRDADGEVNNEIDGSRERECFIQVQTIDMYQGDENKYILVSLVRSNNRKEIGFLKHMNRRCVAQSRAKCGMYLFGDLNVLKNARNSPWYRMINSMIEQDCAGCSIPLQCTNHPSSRYEAKDSEEVIEVTTEPKRLCKEKCGNSYPCGIHACKKSCQPRHIHGLCDTIVDDVFQNCGHPVKRECFRPISQLSCKTEVRVSLQCGHEAKKKCHQQTSRIRCYELVVVTLPQCGHEMDKRCHFKTEDVFCTYPCTKMTSCGVHQCVNKCGNAHGHDSCQKMIHYKFPGCNHPSPRKKTCSEAITWKCTKNVYFIGSCKHEIKKQCHQKEDDVKCSVRPCGKKRNCGHSCRNACGDDCEKGDCRKCHDIYKEKIKKFREDARKKVIDLADKITNKVVPTFAIHEISPTGSTAVEYQMVNDQVVKFIQPMHNWFPKVTKIEKVTNLVLEKKFEKAKSNAFGDLIASKFHGTDDDGLKRITKDGFRMPNPIPPPGSTPGMYGQGIYFATDSSKSAQAIYTKGSQKLLLCQVILGNSKEVLQADPTLNKNMLKSERYDSVFAPRGTAVKSDEFVIFDPDQALPQYIIYFSETNNVLPPSPSSLAAPQQSIAVKKMSPSRSVNLNDPFEIYYNFAESHFRRMAAKSQPPLSPQQTTISSIDIVINKGLEEKFEATKKTFQSQGIPDQEILAYHGTASANIESIIKTNLQLSYARRQVYGRGNYFSEFPAVSLGYGDGLLLCRILPGKEYVENDSSDIPADYNSKKVLLSSQPAGTAANASGKMVIIENSDQILPFFVIHR